MDYFKEHVEMQEEDVFTEEIGKKLLEEVHIEGGRASIETFLHAVTGKYTLHSHPTLVNDGEKRWRGYSAYAFSESSVCPL